MRRSLKLKMGGYGGGAGEDEALQDDPVNIKTTVAEFSERDHLQYRSYDTTLL